ncbi:MAG: TraR/DksA C4-type zinc finger protein [Archangium sp.]|nr:TraR/DksA C4-type zinc finger protein [Archangium sp.]
MSGGNHHVGYGTGMTADARRALVARREVLRGQSSTDALQMELRDIEEALLRIDAGTWGRCLQCGGAIGRDRLRAVPDAKFCVSCGR